MKRTLLVVIALSAAAAVTAHLGAQSRTKPGEWTSYGGDLASRRYSPLDQINKDNFGKLEVAWRF
jgi:glucose dehydrogenase